MRRAFLCSETVFKKDKGLLKELSNYVIEHLGPIYSEMERNAQQVCLLSVFFFKFCVLEFRI